MIEKTILIADNNPNFLEGCAANVRSAGYQVVLAATPDEVRAAIATGVIHVAVIDVRMTDDNDRSDLSGRDLALKIPTGIGIILMTTFMTFDLIRAVNQEFTIRNRPYQYIDKLDEGAADRLIEYIERSLTHHVQINFDLKWISASSKALTAVSLAQALNSSESIQTIANKASELEGVLRRVFNDCKSIRITEVLWGDVSASAVLCRVERGLEIKTHAVFLVEKSRRDSHIASQIEIDYSEVAMGVSSSRISHSVHFLAWVANTNVAPENLLRLVDIARYGNKRMRPVLSHLFRMRLLGLQRKQQLAVIPDGLLTHACEVQLNWPDQRDLLHHMSSQIDQLLAVLSGFGWRIERKNGELLFMIGGKQRAWVDPVNVVESALEDSADNNCEPDCSPGRLTTDKVYADSDNHAWLLMPLVVDAVPKAWDLAATEASIRFDLAPKLEPANMAFIQNIPDQYELENNLIWHHDRGLKCLSGKGPTQNHAVLMEGVETLRALAEESGVEPHAYFQSLLMHLAHRWLTVETGLLPHREAMWAGYALLATSMLGTALMKAMPLTDAPPQSVYAGPTFEIVSDALNQIRVRGELRTLTPTTFRLFGYLLDHVGQICKREHIFEAVFGSVWDQAAPALTTEACRLRDTIEPRRKGSRPIYLETVRGVGYRLIDPAAVSDL